MMTLRNFLVCVFIVSVTCAPDVVNTGFECPEDFDCECETKQEDGQTINLVNCQARGLAVIPEFHLLNYPYEICIDLSNNTIQEVPDNSFTNLRIKWVKFNNNPVKKMSDRAFQGVINVQTIICNNCSLPAVPSIFEHTRGLEVLNLELNNISKIPAGSFGDSSLKELYIGNNVLFPTEDMFTDLADTLERLSLYRLFQWKIPVSAVNKLRNLKRLDLLYNQIASIKKTDIDQLPMNITYLDLSNNPIEKIEPGSFEGFVNGREGVTINLTNTKLTAIDFIDDACRINKVYMPLEGSPLTCDCQLYNLTRNHVLNTTGFCHLPEKFRWYSVYGNKSFVSETYDVEKSACPEVWKLPCHASMTKSTPIIMATVAILLYILRI